MSVIPANNPVNMQPHTVNSVQNLKNQLFGKFQTVLQQNEVSERKIATLEALQGKITELTSAMSDVEKSNDSRLKGLVWWKRFLEKLAYYCYVSIGTYASTLYAIQAARTELIAQTKVFQKKEFTFLSAHNNPNEGSILYVRLYELIASFHAETKAHLAQYADRLIIEGAFNAAIEALNEYITLNPDTALTAKERRIVALKGAKKYQEALDAIASIKVEINQDPRHTPYLDYVKAEVLIDQKRYSEAKSELANILGGALQHASHKRKMMQATLLEELSQNSEHYFMARSKKLFGQLEEFAKETWSEESMNTELAFWMHLLQTEKGLHENAALFTRVTDEIMHLIEHKMITPNTVIKGLEKMAGRIKQETELLDRQYHVFLDETAKEIPMKKELKEEIMKARLETMKARLHGISGSQSFAGILHMHAAIKTIATKVAAQDGFTSSDQKTKLQTIKDSGSQVTAKLQGIANSLTEVYQGGFHPYISSLQNSLGNADAILAIAS